MFDGPWETCVLVRGLNPGECASWVQAWGSIGAIIVTALVAGWAYRRAQSDQRLKERRERQERDRTIGQMFSESARIFKRVTEIEAAMRPDRETNRMPDAAVLQYINFKVSGADRLDNELFAVQTYISALQRVDVVQLAELRTSTALIRGLFGLQKLAAHLELMRASFDPADSGAHAIFGGLDDAARAVREAHEVFIERASR